MLNLNKPQGTRNEIRKNSREERVHAQDIYERFLNPPYDGEKPRLTETEALELAHQNNEDFTELILNEIRNDRYTPSDAVKELLSGYGASFEENTTVH